MEINQVTMSGNLTRDPEIRCSAQGAPVCKFTIAVNRYSKDKDKKEVDYFDVVSFNKTAEIINDNLKKGNKAVISGELRQNRWEALGGTKRSRVEIIAMKVIFTSYNRKEPVEEEVADDDIPF